VRLWDDVAAVATLLGALTAHPSLRTLSLAHNPLAHEAEHAAAGAALGALLAANAPALTELDVPACDLGDAGMAPLLQALPHNTHLRKLDVSHSHMSEAFARDVLLPAVRANASLRSLTATWHGRGWPAEFEAEAVVARRAAASDR
jgi:hypothetical protein